MSLEQTDPGELDIYATNFEPVERDARRNLESSMYLFISIHDDSLITEGEVEEGFVGFVRQNIERYANEIGETSPRFLTSTYNRVLARYHVDAYREERMPRIKANEFSTLEITQEAA